MLIENENLLDEFRKPGHCELCGKLCGVREPHHVRTKGACGGSLDVRINILTVGSSTFAKHYYCPCHRLAQEYKIPVGQVLAVIADREHCKVEEITEVMDLFVRLIRPTELQLLESLADLSDGGLRLAVRELREAGRIK